MSKGLKLFLSFFVILGWILAIGSLYYLDQVEIETKIVKCYDRDYNEIIGVTCEETNYKDIGDRLIQNGLAVLLGPLIIFSCLVFVIIIIL